MRTRLLRVVSVGLVAALAFLIPSPASAWGIYCSAYSWYGPSGGMICSIKCVYCEDQETGELLSEVCYEEVCWFGGREPL